MDRAGRTVRQATLVRLVNRAGGLLQSRRPQLRADRLVERARRRTGLEDFDGTSWRVGLVRLVDSLESEARLSQVGRIAAWFNLFDLLCVRLRMVEERKRRPEIAAQAKPATDPARLPN